MAGCGGGDDPAPQATPAKRTPVPGTFPVESDGELAVGITEPNPAFLRTDDALPPEFAKWRDALAKLHPAYYRVVLQWNLLEPEPGTYAFENPNGGCMRDIPPCASYAGLKEQLQRLGERQREGGYEAMMVLTGTPAWAASPPRGCERGGTAPLSRAPRASALPAYRKLIGKVLGLAQAEGVELRYWSAWNEPNHPYFISPQRNRCSGKAPSQAIAPYAALSRELKAALDDAPGKQEIVLGELAGLRKRGKPRYTSISEFIGGLPEDVVCAARIFGQHGYVGGPDPVKDAASALERRGCDQTHEIWVTETGAGAPRSGAQRDEATRAARASCERLHKRLKRWYEDPRVTAAFQYTLREDDRFPTGLVTAELDRAYPALAEWIAWGTEARPEAQDPPPEAPSCR